ncbi:MAG: UvrD-helicase domain-containing protein [Candidatus Cloacimonadaceae bacterium]
MQQLNSETIEAYIEEAEKVFLPSGMHFDDNSRSFIKSLETVDVQACPGSGKTTALIAKLYIFSKFMPFENNKGICVLTHTNVAIDEIKNKMGKSCNILFSYPNFFGTIHSFIDRFLLLPYYKCEYKNNISYIDNELYNKKINNYMKYNYIKNNYDEQIYKLLYHWLKLSNKLEYPYNIRFSLKNIEELVVGIECKPITFKFGKKEFSDYEKTMILKVLKDIKMDMLKSGQLCYDDSYSLSYHYLRKRPRIINAISSRFKYLFIDEMQDTAKYQIDLLDRTFSTDVIKQRIGDSNQSIYSHSGYFKDETDWLPIDNQIHIYKSKRISKQIAKSIKYICITPETYLEGVDRGDDENLKPIIIIFNDETKKDVLKEYAKIIKEREYLWEGKITNPVYYAVGWIHEKKDDELTAKHEEKLSIKSYFPDYNKPSKLHSVVFDTLLNYIVRPSSVDTLNSAKPIYDNIINCLLRVLDLCEIKNNDRRFTKKSLLEYMSQTNQKELETLKTKCANWVRQIKRHCCKDDCPHKDKIYPTCIIKDMKKYISEKWAEIFHYDENKINDFLINDLQEISPTASNVDNIFTYNNIDVHVGTVHSVKGQTHTATLFLECFYVDFNCNQLLEFFKKNNTSKDKNDTTRINKSKKEALKIAYVAMSRPTHLLCVAFHKARCPEQNYNALKENGWEIKDISNN